MGRSALRRLLGARRREPGPIGVVLAGGEGRRLGGDKAVVDLDGRPLLTYPLGALRAAVGDVAVVAKHATRLPQLGPEVAIWLEHDEPRHPMAGVVRALTEARGRAVLCLAVDLPLVPVDVLCRIATTPAEDGARAVVPRDRDGRLQPLCARYDPGALEVLAGFDPATPATTLAQRLQPVVFDVATEDAFHNVNTPDDLLRASALRSVRRR